MVSSWWRWCCCFCVVVYFFSLLSAILFRAHTTFSVWFFIHCFSFQLEFYKIPNGVGVGVGKKSSGKFCMTFVSLRTTFCFSFAFLPSLPHSVGFFVVAAFVGVSSTLTDVFACHEKFKRVPGLSSKMEFRNVMCALGALCSCVYVESTLEARHSAICVLKTRTTSDCCGRGSSFFE